MLSLWAYVWLFICLDVLSPGEVDIAEAWITFASFIFLVLIAFAADKWFYKKMDDTKSAEQNLLDLENQALQINKTKLRSYVLNYGDETVCNIG